MPLPRLPLAAVVLAFLFLLRLALPFNFDPDFWWHLRTGEAFLNAGTLHAHDVFSYASKPELGVLAEWLSQIVLWLIYRTGGLPLTNLFVAAVVTLYCALTYRSCHKLLQGDEGKAILVTLACALIACFVAPRPQLFSFLLFAGLLGLLIDCKYFQDTRRLWLLPPMFLLWANLHGGYFIGLVMLGLFLASEWLRYCLRNDGDAVLSLAALRRLTFWAGAALLATALNPHHFAYWLYPFEMLFASSGMNTIAEWLSPDFHNPFNLYFLLLVFGFFLALLHARRRFDLTEILLPSLFIATAFVSQRNLPLAALAMAPFLALALQQRSYLPDEGHAATRQLGHKENGLNWLLLLAALAGLGFSYPGISTTLEKAAAATVPAKAVDFIEQHGIQGRMFNSYNHGGYLVYRLYPQRQVYVYGREDVYGKAFMRDYWAMYRGRANWRPLFEQQRIDYAILENDTPLRQLLLAGQDFRLVYENEHDSVLLRDLPQYRELIARYGRAPSEQPPRKAQPEAHP
ncbi:MAG: hypothetical protein KUL75_07000 [Sterolibacterium sp.]|nr:hypothetical protein [Sterolibacterium sp.]